MKKLNKNLSEIFDVEPIEEARIETLPVVVNDNNNQIIRLMLTLSLLVQICVN